MSLKQIEAFSLTIKKENDLERAKQIENYRISQASQEDYLSFMNALNKDS